MRSSIIAQGIETHTTSKYKIKSKKQIDRPNGTLRYFMKANIYWRHQEIEIYVLFGKNYEYEQLHAHSIVNKDISDFLSKEGWFLFSGAMLLSSRRNPDNIDII